MCADLGNVFSLLSVGSEICLYISVLSFIFIISRLSLGTATSLRRLEIIALSIIFIVSIYPPTLELLFALLTSCGLLVSLSGSRACCGLTRDVSSVIASVLHLNRSLARARFESVVAAKEFFYPRSVEHSITLFICCCDCIVSCAPPPPLPN